MSISTYTILLALELYYRKKWDVHIGGEKNTRNVTVVSNLY